MEFDYRPLVNDGSEQAFEVWLGDRYVGMVASMNKKWCATWNMVPRDSTQYLYNTKEIAVEALLHRYHTH